MTSFDPRKLSADLARRSYESGDYGRCLEFAEQLGASLPKDLALMVSDAAYRLAREAAAQDRTGDAVDLFGRTYELTARRALRIICQRRIELLRGMARRGGLGETPCPVCDGLKSVYTVRRLCADQLVPEVDEVYCVGAYRSGFDSERSNPFSEMIRRMKKPDGAALLPHAGDLLAHFVRRHLGLTVQAQVDLLIPVPTTPARYASRNYGVPEELAKRMELDLAIPSFPQLVSLDMETRDLRRLNRYERESELQGAFSVTDPTLVEGHTVMVVDDVITYGTTQREIGRTLKAVGARKVIGLALAHSESSRSS